MPVVIARCRVTGFDGRDGPDHARHDLRRRVRDRVRADVRDASRSSPAWSCRSTTFLRHKVVLPDVPAVPQWAPLVFDEDTGAHWRPALRGAYALISVGGQEPCRPSTTR